MIKKQTPCVRVEQIEGATVSIKKQRGAAELPAVLCPDACQCWVQTEARAHAE